MAAKKKPVFYDTKDLVTIREYNHEGIKILVEIDRQRGKISLLEQTSAGTYKPKKWEFAERDIEYMNGWRHILKAMDLAVMDAQADLAEYQKQQKDKKLHDAVDLHVVLNKMKAPK